MPKRAASSSTASTSLTPPSRHESSWQTPIASACMSCLNIVRFWQCSPVAVELGEPLRVRDRLLDVPDLVGVHHQEAVRADLLADQRGAAQVVLQRAADLHLHVAPALRDRIAGAPVDLVVGVAEPADRGRVGGEAVAAQLGDALAAAGCV